MKRLFIEAEGFRRKIDILGRDLLVAIQQEILKDPEKGNLIPRLGGVRKLRIGNPQQSKGKRGGYRVIYLDVANQFKTYLLWIYKKGELENILPDEKKIIRKLVIDLKKGT